MIGWYQQFIKNFAQRASPLTAFLKNNARTMDIHTPGTAANVAFEELKKVLTVFPILRLPNFSKEFILIFDRSNVGTGCVLAQEYNGFEHPIHYHSKSLKDEQRHWHSYEIEALALLRGLKAFKHFLGDEIKCVTDCHALSYILQKKEISKKLERYLSELSEYPVLFEHRPREKLVVVDALAKNENWMQDEHEYLKTKVLEGRVIVKLDSRRDWNFRMSGSSSTEPAPQEISNENALGINAFSMMEEQFFFWKEGLAQFIDT
jgi:hypothetical protein